MENAIKLDSNKIIIDLVELNNIKIDCVLKHLKELVYHNTIDVFYVIADEYDTEKEEFYFFKDHIEKFKREFKVFLMLETRFFPSTKFYDSIFALGVDALSLSVSADDEASDKFKKTMQYVTNLWPSGAVFSDIVVADCSDDVIKKKISKYSKMKVIPRILKEISCATGGDAFCVRDYILKRLKKNGVSLKWVMNFELCSVIQQDAGGKGRSKRRFAGKVALELASLRRKLMVKEVESSFDSASL
jgi:hypothetical protein